KGRSPHRGKTQRAELPPPETEPPPPEAPTPPELPPAPPELRTPVPRPVLVLPEVRAAVPEVFVPPLVVLVPLVERAFGLLVLFVVPVKPPLGLVALVFAPLVFVP